MDASTPFTVARRVLLVIEEPLLAELLAEALGDAGHRTETAAGDETLATALERTRFDAVIVDLDTRARNGGALVARIRQHAPAATVIALLPCGGGGGHEEAAHYHLALEKPARLSAILSAVNVARPLVGG